MARIRSVHPGQWTDGDFLECSPLARLLALAIRNIADDRGAFRWKPTTIKATCLPADNCDIDALLGELIDAGQIIRYEIEGKAYGLVLDFCQWQRPKKPQYVHPVPDEFRTSSEPVPNQCGTSTEIPPQREEVGGRKEEEKKEDVLSVAKATRPRKSYSVEFEDFWKAYPRTPTMSKPEAWKQWQRLPEGDRPACTSAVPKFVEWARKQRDYTMLHACRFISQRRFEGFASDDTAKTVTVYEILPTDPKWEIWWEWYGTRKNDIGKSMGQSLMKQAKDMGKPFIVQTPYPPNIGNQTATTEHAA